ncbi:MAG: nucleoside diphosphate kinase regulator [Myxococcales bacterium]|nr:MAG: nucleoside diphosphate kinase regulator [Myxococcales bacterium]
MFADHVPTLTDFDFRRLDALFDRIRRQVAPPPTLSVLERDLGRAVVVPPDQVPSTVVTMNSRAVVLDLDNQERRELTLVFPSSADIEAGRVSVLAPLGSALIGSREGSDISWRTPRGERRMRVERVVYQPEAAGRFDL